MHYRVDQISLEPAADSPAHLVGILTARDAVEAAVKAGDIVLHEDGRLSGGALFVRLPKNAMVCTAEAARELTVVDAVDHLARRMVVRGRVPSEFAPYADMIFLNIPNARVVLIRPRKPEDNTLPTQSWEYLRTSARVHLTNLTALVYGTGSIGSRPL